MINLIKPWFTIDKRILGIYRIFFGLLIFSDIWRRWDTRHIFYSNEGIVHHYNNSSYFSLLNILNNSLQPWIIDLFFIIGILSSILFIVGFKTKLSQLISVIVLISLHNRVILVENAGDFVMNCMMIWTLFLPLGSSISFDSLKMSLKENNDFDTNSLNNELIQKSYEYKSIAYFAILFQISAIYFFTGLNKTGTDWMSGTAVHYMYQLDTFLTPFGFFIRNHVGVLFSKIATYGTLALELAVPILLFSPFYTRYLRQIAVVSLVIFHLIIMSSLSIGLFSQTMIVSFILLLDGRLLDSLKSYFTRSNNQQYILFYDSDCGFCHYSARIIKRLDIFNRIIFDNQYTNRNKPDEFDELVKNTAVVFNPETKEIWIKHLAFSKLISLFPLGFLFSWIFYIPGISHFLKKIYEQVAKNRTQISTLMGLKACDIKNHNESGLDEKVINHNNKYIEKIFYFLNTIIVSVLLIACINYNLVANKAVNEYMTDYGFEKINYIKPLKKMMSYPRMIQKWNMFSPSVLKRDKWLVVEATLSDGTIVDPFTGNPPVLDSVDYEFLWSDINQFWRKYLTRIEKKRTQVKKLKKWLTKKENNYFKKNIGNNQIESVNIWFLTQLNGSPTSNKKNKVYKKELPLKRKTKSNKNKNKDILEIIRDRNKIKARNKK